MRFSDYNCLLLTTSVLLIKKHTAVERKCYVSRLMPVYCVKNSVYGEHNRPAVVKKAVSVAGLD